MNDPPVSMPKWPAYLLAALAAACAVPAMTMPHPMGDAAEIPSTAQPGGVALSKLDQGATPNRR